MNKVFAMLTQWGGRAGKLVHQLVRVISYAGPLITTALLHAPQAQAQSAWKMVVPWRPQLVTVDVPVMFASHLTQELKVPVVLEESVYNKHEEALTWALEIVKKQPTLVLFSEELSVVGEGARSSPRHISHYEPLIMIWQSRWCLFADANSPLQNTDALKAWMTDPAATPTVAITEPGGPLSIWLQGMERRTKRKWNVHVYGLRGSILDALDKGAGVALSYCNRQKLHPNRTRILAQSGPLRSELLPDVPLFSEVGWAPMAKGWMAWMVPKDTPADQKEKMAQALYRVMGKPAVQAQLRSTGHVVQHVSPAVSKQYIESFAETWRNIDTLFSMTHDTVPSK